MKKLSIFPLLAILLSLSSCELVGDIFKVGVWAGILLVVGIVAVIFFIISKLGRK